MAIEIPTMVKLMTDAQLERFTDEVDEILDFMEEGGFERNGRNTIDDFRALGAGAYAESFTRLGVVIEDLVELDLAVEERRR